MPKTPPPSAGPAPAKDFADSTKLPEARESTSDTTWELFKDLETRENARFAETEQVEHNHTNFPRTVRVPRPGGSRNAATLDEALVEARKNERVCPQPVFWYQLFDLLPPLPRRPDPPPEGQSWRTASAAAKRVMLRDHLDFAERSGVLDKVLALLRKLREADWVHEE